MCGFIRASCAVTTNHWELIKINLYIVKISLLLCPVYCLLKKIDIDESSTFWMWESVDCFQIIINNNNK